MNHSQRPTAAQLLEWFEVPKCRNVFVLGSFGRQVTFASQQTRALNLIWALVEDNRLREKQRIGIVGAGLGGLTAAVAALNRNCEVHIFEQASQTCPVQRGNDSRFIHPNILTWPDEGCEKSQTEFPFLNWSAASARSVITQIDSQWKQIRNSDLKCFYNYRVESVRLRPRTTGVCSLLLSANRMVDGNAASASGTEVTSPGFIEQAYDFVILAVGFGDEQTIPDIASQSYWENDSLHQETGRGRGNILVSGCGDGGLVDALRLRVRNFSHSDFVRKFLEAAGSKELTINLKRIDQELQENATATDISLRFRQAYDGMRRTPGLKKIEDYFRNERRMDTSVTLNSPSEGPLTFRASLLNRFAIYLAIKHAGLHYLAGRIAASRLENGAYQVTFIQEGDGDGEMRVFDRLIVRHGPKSSVTDLLPKASIAEFRAWWSARSDITALPHWKSGGDRRVREIFGVDSASGPPVGPEALNLALATFEPAYRKFTESQGGSEIESFAVGRDSGKTCFVARLRPGAPPRDAEMFAGLLVKYINQASETGRATGPNALQAGMGIYNLDAAVRRRRSAGMAHGDRLNKLAIGTLGCFATDGKYKYLIGLRLFLDPFMEGRVGDRIALEDGDSIVATLAVWGSKNAEYGDRLYGSDLAAAKIVGNCSLRYDLFPDEFRPSGVQKITSTVEVATVGRTSELSEGIVTLVPQESNIVEGSYFEIHSKKSRDFSRSGDGGALVVAKGGAALGFVYARYAGGGATLASPISEGMGLLGLKALFAAGRKRNKV